MKTEINSFRGPNRWLSNFFLNPVVLDGVSYPSNEHAYMAQKAPLDSAWQKQCQDPSILPSDIKKLSRQVQLILGWDELRIPTMEKCLRAKFQCPMLKEKLLATGDAVLLEGNSWGDDFWGVNELTGEGENHLGKLIMKIRDELKNI